MKKIVLSTIVAAAAAMSLSAAAIPGSCAGCHGADFGKSAMGKSGIVKGWDAAKIETALKGYKAGTLNTYGMGALMKGQVANLSDADIADIAKQIAAMK